MGLLLDGIINLLKRNDIFLYVIKTLGNFKKQLMLSDILI
jgi:hypothetical protein